MKFVLKNPCQQQWIFPGNEAMHVPSPSVFAHRLTSLGRTVFRHNRIEAICPESPCQQPRQRSYRPVFAHRLTSLGHTVFRNIRRDVIYPENPCAQLCLLTILLPPNGALPKLFPTVSLPSPNYFPRFPFRPPSRSFHIAPSQWSCPRAISHNFPSVHPFIASVSLLPLGALPKLFPTVSLPSTLSLLPYRSFPTELSPCHCPRFPICPPCRRFHIVPSSRSSPQTISHAFLPVHLDIASVSLLPIGSSPPCYLPQFSLPSTLSSFPYRSFPTELSPCYFPRFPFRPPCRHSVSLLPTRALQAISHGFPSVHPLVASVSLLPTGAVPMLFPTVSLPSTLSFPVSLLPTGALPELFPTVHPVATPVSPLPTGALPKLFPMVSLPSTLSSLRIAPSNQSSPQPISHGFPSVHPLVASVSLLPTGALPKLFPTVSLPSTLSSFAYRSFPPELSPSYFPRFPFRPPCHHSRIAPSHKPFPTAHQSSPSYFPRFPFRPPSPHFRIAPSHRSSRHAISHGFLSVHPVVIPVSLLPTGALPKLFPTVSLPSAVSSLLYRSFPPELSPCYLPRFPFRPPCPRSRTAPSQRSSPQAISHGFPSVHPVVPPAWLRPTGALPKLFPTASLPSTLASLPYRSFPP